MNYGKIFAYLIVFLNVCASVGYFWHGDVRHGLYWAFAAAITTVVTF